MLPGSLFSYISVLSLLSSTALAMYDLLAEVTGPHTEKIDKSLETLAPIFNTGKEQLNTRAQHIHHPHPSFVNCSLPQQNSLLEAIKLAELYAQEASKYFEVNTDATARYVTWFGAYDSLRYNIVKDHFRSISSFHSFSSFKYDCTCTKEGSWGYVIPDEFGVIYLCPTFWTLPIKGKESMAGSLVQKSSHFVRNGGAVDYVYSQPLCKDLAISNATKAIRNADSYEYFAENDPVIE